MKVLFVVSKLFYSEPLGVMQLSAICKRYNCSTRLVSLLDHSLIDVLNDYIPDLICYSAMTSDDNLFKEGDKVVVGWMKMQGLTVQRVMGGAHPTYFPEVLKDLELDAICVGDGDHAIIEILERIREGKSFIGIPNILTKDGGELIKEVVEDLDSLPVPDRDILYEAIPALQKVGIRSFLTQRGCPYKCTYCFNHSYSKLFGGDGRKLIRRRSVDGVIKEILEVIDKFPPVKFIRFSDDVFVGNNGRWIKEFMEKYKKNVGVPFYCLMRADTFSEEIAALLHGAGCHSIAMSIESGDELVRERILKRKMSDDILSNAFRLADKYDIKVYANTMLGLPGTTIVDDLNSYLFAKKMRVAAPTFGVYQPFPKTELASYAINIGCLDIEYDYNNTFTSPSQLTCYTDEERACQYRLSRLASIFCYLPDYFDSLLFYLIKINITSISELIDSIFSSYLMGVKIFPNAYPKNPYALMKSAYFAIKYSAISKKNLMSIKK